MQYMKSAPREDFLSEKYLGYVFYQFLPIVLELNSRRLIEYSKACNKSSLGFLSREGFLLKVAFDHWVSLRPSSQGFKSDYLHVSRRALNRYLVGSEDYDIKYVLHELYEGTVLNFLNGRFSLEQYEVAEFFSPQQLKKRISWGERDEILLVVETLNCQLREHPLPDRDLLKQYLINFVNEDTILVDVGFKGTMQQLINLSFPYDVHGFYFALSPDAWSHKFQGSAISKSRSNVLIKDSILIESLLTAPHGTTLKYEKTKSGVIPKLENQIEFEVPYSIEKILLEMEKFIDFSDVQIEEMFWVAWGQALRAMSQLTSSQRNLFRVEDKWSRMGSTLYGQI